jgi:acyl-CoA dehydrogenase
MVLRGASLYDAGRDCGAEANIAKYLGGEYGHKAADQAMQTLGGYGYSKEYHVERLWRESKLARIAPVSPELILCYLAERKLGLPRSY